MQIKNRLICGAVFGLLGCLLLVIVDISTGDFSGLGKYLVGFLAFGLAGAIAGYPYLRGTIERKEKSKKKEQEKQEKLKAISSGEWQFPVDEFYKKCLSEKAAAVTNELAFRKMMLIAKNILDMEGVPREYIPLYYDEEKVKQYFKVGKERATAARRNAQEEKALRKATPQDAELTPDMEEVADMHDALKDELYRNKRKLQLETLIGITERKIQEAKRAYDSALLTSAALSASAKQTPKKDWALIGGIAQGIAGPAAGAIAASQAIAENERMEYENRQDKAIVDKQALSIAQIASDRYLPKKEQLTEELERYKKDLEKLPLKLVFEEYDTDDLFQRLEISGSVSRPKNESVTVTINVLNHYDPKIKNYTVVMDGILEAKLYCDDIFVDGFFIALPENGVAYDEKAAIKQYPRKYMIGEKRNYRLEFLPHNLWLMER